MDSRQLSKAFVATVQASLHGLAALEPLLRQEQAVLRGKDPGPLEQIARDKLELLRQVEHSIQARDQLLRAGGLEDGQAGAASLVERIASPELGADWQRLVDLGRTVAGLNEQNGRLVLQGQRRAKAALEILTGRPSREDTYSTLRRRGAGAARYSLGKV